MNAKHNAALVAVQAEPCQKQDSHDQPMPIQKDRYSRRQLMLILESIAGDMNTLKEILEMAQCSEEDWSRTRLVNAASALAQGIGCMADDATGGTIIGGIGQWHCGQSFTGEGAAA